MDKKEIENKITQINSNLDKIEDEAKKSQEESVKIVSVTDRMRETTNYFNSQLNSYENIEKKYSVFSDDINKINTQLTNLLSYTNSYISKLTTVNLGLKEIKSSLSGDATGLTVQAYTVTASLSGISEKNNEPNFFTTYKIEEPAFKFESVDNQELDNYLLKYFPKANLVKRREGAWSTYYSASEDNKAQAAHSMRDILAFIISDWGSNDEVKKAVWWKPASLTKEVDLKQRLRLLLFGQNMEIDNNELNQINDTIEEYYDEDSLLKKIAHGSQKKHESIKYSMKAIENCMLLIFRKKEGIR